MHLLKIDNVRKFIYFLFIILSFEIHIHIITPLHIFLICDLFDNYFNYIIQNGHFISIELYVIICSLVIR